MKKITNVAIALAALTLLTTPVAALAITNDDVGVYKIAVVEGDQRTEYDLVAKGTVDAACRAICEVSIVKSDGDDDGTIEVAGTDKVIVKGGEINMVKAL